MAGTDMTYAIRQHIQDGKTQHPDLKPFDAYPSILRQWAKYLEDADTDPNDEHRKLTQGRLMLQVAGLMVRGIEELHLPLTLPKGSE